MADISQIKLPSGTTYDIKDTTARTALTGSAWDNVAREAIAGGVSFIVAWDGASTPVVANIPAGVVVTYQGTSYTGTLSAETTGSGTHAQAGAFYLVHSSDGARNAYAEYVPVGTEGSKYWEKIGDSDIDLSDYAKKGDGITGTAASKVTGISLSAHSVTAATVSASGSYTPAGGNAKSAVTISPTTTDVYSMTSAGSVTAGSANVPTEIDVDKFDGGSYTRGTFSGGSGSFTQGAFSGGSFTQGSKAAWSATVSNETLTFSWTANGDDSFTAATHASDVHTHTAATHAADSFTPASLESGFYTPGTAGTPTSVTLPGRSSKILAWTGYNSGVNNTYAAAQSFTGTEGTVSVTGTASVTIANHTVTDNGHTHTVDGTIDT